MVNEIQRQRDDGTWEPAEPLPFYYGLVSRFLRWLTRGRWPK